MLSELPPIALTLLGGWLLWSVASTALSLLPELVPVRIVRETRSTASLCRTPTAQWRRGRAWRRTA